jgi:hypothetical protein
MQLVGVNGADMALPPLPGKVLPRCGPIPPAGFFPSSAVEPCSSTVETVTLAPRCKAAVVDGCVTLVTTCDVRDGDVLFEETLLFVANVTPTLLAGPPSAASSTSDPRSAASRLLPTLPPSQTEVGRSFTSKAGALWRLVTGRFSPKPSATEPPRKPTTSSLLDEAGLLGTPLGTVTATVEDQEDLAVAQASAFSAAVGACIAGLEAPECAPLTALSGLTLRDVCASQDAARASVQVAVLLHKVAAASAASQPKPVALRLQPEDIAFVHALALEDLGARLLSLYADGPVAMGVFTSCLRAVPFAGAANCRLEVCDGASDVGGLRVRCVAGTSAELNRTADAPVTIRKGVALRCLRQPLVLREDLETADGIPKLNSANGTRLRPALYSGTAARPGESDAEAARRRLLGFVDAAKKDPAAMHNLVKPTATM